MWTESSSGIVIEGPDRNVEGWNGETGTGESGSTPSGTNCEPSFCAYAILHAIAKGQEHKHKVLFGPNTLLAKFNQFLRQRKDVGIAVMDRMPGKDQFKYLKDKFQLGAKFSDGYTRRLENIVGYTITCDGASHLASMADILLGSFRYCVNEPDREANAAIFPTLAQVMWHEKKSYLEYGLMLRPKDIKAKVHEKEYTALRDRLRGYLIAKKAAG